MDYPFTGHYFDQNGIAQHYLDEGQGEPILMVHGNPSWSFYYRKIVKALRENYRCIVPDHIGMGYSDKPDDSAYDYTLQRRVDDLCALMDSLNLDQPLTLMVHDWGGMIGMAYAVRNPEKIKRLIILNTAAFHKPPGKKMPWQLGIVRDTPLGSWAVRYLNAFVVGAAWLGVTRRAMPASVRNGYCAPYNTPENRRAVLRFVQDIPLKPGDRAYDLVTEIQQSLYLFKETPALICWGMKDFVFDQYFLREWQNVLPQAQVVEFPDSGHYVLEDAAEDIIPLVKDFLAR